MKTEDCFYIGYITKTKGLKGEVQVYFEYDDPEKLTFNPLFADLNGKLVPHFVSSFRLFSNQTGNFYFEDIHSIADAEKLIHKRLYLPNTMKPERDDEPATGTLTGYIVHDKQYGELGEIIDIHQYPQQSVAVVHYQHREIMFPLNDDFIKEIDEDAGVVHVELPDGLVDIYLNQGS